MTEDEAAEPAEQQTRISVIALASELRRRSRWQTAISLSVFALIMAVSGATTWVLLYPNAIVRSGAEASAVRAQRRLERQISDEQKELQSLGDRREKPVRRIDDKIAGLIDRFSFEPPPNAPEIVQGDPYASWQRAQHFTSRVGIPLGLEEIARLKDSAALAAYVNATLIGEGTRVDAVFVLADGRTRVVSSTFASLHAFASSLAKQDFGLPFDVSPIDRQIARLQSDIFNLQAEQSSVKQLLTEIQAGVTFDTADNRPAPTQDVLQTNLLRLAAFSIASIIIYFLVSVYRFRARLATFYRSRADALGLVEHLVDPKPLRLGNWLSPDIDFGRPSGSAARELATMLAALVKRS